LEYQPGEEMEEHEYVSALGKAISLWQRGEKITLDLYSELIADGFDVSSLENRYFNKEFYEQDE
jgi:hypothetical protein